MWMVGVFAMTSLSGLHSWVCSARCDMLRLGWTYLLSLDHYGYFLCDKEFCSYGFVSPILQ